MKFWTSISLLILPALSGCGAKSSAASGQCSTVQSILNGQQTSQASFSKASAGLLLSTHFETASSTWDAPQRLSKCNATIELLHAETKQLRLWTASHCVTPLLLTSLKLAMRDENSSIGGFVTWNLSHPILNKAEKMRKAYTEISPNSYSGAREKLLKAFDRSNMWVKDESSFLAPRTSCENLRWLTPADALHALCFTVHDLIHYDITLPEPESEKSKELISALQKNNKSASTEQAIAEKRALFLRRIGLLSQIEWITTQEQNLVGYLNNPQSGLPSTEVIAAGVARLQKEVFDLPHPEESSFMTPINVTTQDQPTGSNQTLSVIKSGTYSSTRLTSPLNDVTVACVRSLRKWESGVVKTLSELEYRPHAYCPGGANPQPDHVWYREYQWSRMVTDLTLGAAKDYTNAVSQQIVSSGVLGDWASRVSVVSNFSVDDQIDFFNQEPDAVSPFLSALKIPATLFSDKLYGWNGFVNTGAFMLALKKDSVKARFLKGDSGAMLLLDGVPIATLYSVDGEETSGGASIRALPTAESEEVSSGAQVTGSAAGSRSSVSNSSSPSAPSATSKNGKIPLGCLR